MDSKKEGALYLLVLLLTPIIVYFGLKGEIVAPYRSGGTLGICFVSILSGLVMFYVIYRAREKYFSKNIDFSEIDEERSTKSYSDDKRSKKRKKSGILDVFSSKNKCGTCGTKMEYKENMDCYYCPECHEYK